MRPYCILQSYASSQIECYLYHVCWVRLLLSAIECSGSQQLRLVVSTQLAELLLSAISSASYVPPALPGMVTFSGEWRTRTSQSFSQVPSAVCQV